jgi:glutamate transport system permease protein
VLACARLVLAFGRLSHRLWISLPAVAVIEFFRGVPLLLLIFALFLGAPLVLGIDLPALWALVIGLTLYNGAVIAEIVRAGILAIPKGQSEAAMAIGSDAGRCCGWSCSRRRCGSCCRRW